MHLAFKELHVRVYIFRRALQLPHATNKRTLHCHKNKQSRAYSRVLANTFYGSPMEVLHNPHTHKKKKKKKKNTGLLLGFLGVQLRDGTSQLLHELPADGLPVGLLTHQAQPHRVLSDGGASHYIITVNCASDILVHVRQSNSNYQHKINKIG